MTLEEVKQLHRNDKVLYQGEVWKFKAIGKIGVTYTVKIQRGNDIHFCAFPEQLKRVSTEES